MDQEGKLDGFDKDVFKLAVYRVSIKTRTLWNNKVKENKPRYNFDELLQSKGHEVLSFKCW